MKSTVPMDTTVAYEGCAHASTFILKGECKIQRPFRSSQTGAFHFAKSTGWKFREFVSSNENKFSTWKFNWNTGGRGGGDTVGIQNVFRGISPIYQETVYKLS